MGAGPRRSAAERRTSSAEVRLYDELWENLAAEAALVIAAAMMSTLFVVAGQSNALVFGTTAAELPAFIQATPRAQIWDWRQQKFDTMRPGQNTNAALATSAGAFGPEVMFAHLELQKNPNETLYFVKDKAVQGLTPLALNPDGWDWSPHSRDEQWSKATTQVVAARAAIPDLKNVVVLWMRGESDALSPETDAAYGENLADLVAHMRVEWGASQVLIGRISAVWGEDSNVRVVQAARGAFSTDHYPLQPDRRHFSAAGAVMLGHDFWAAYERSSGDSAGASAN